MKKRVMMIMILLIVVLCGYLLIKLDYQHIMNVLQSFPDHYKIFILLFLIMIQIIIAFVPGEPLELCAGYLFGPYLGTALCLLGTCLGTFLVYIIVQRYGMKVISLFFKEEKIHQWNQLIEQKRSLLWLFVLFLIPGTPKDMMTYMVSLSHISLVKWLVISTLGRIPSIVTSTFFIDYLCHQNYLFASVILIMTVVLGMIGLIYYHQLKGGKS